MCRAALGNEIWTTLSIIVCIGSNMVNVVLLLVLADSPGMSQRSSNNTSVRLCAGSARLCCSSVDPLRNPNCQEWEDNGVFPEARKGFRRSG